MEIIPAILTRSRDEITERLTSLAGLDLTVQIDFMDGQFVPSRSLPPDDLPDELALASWEAHLMVQEPVAWSQPLYTRGVKRLYWHVEALPADAIIPHHHSDVEHGLALMLDTPIEVLEPFLSMAQSVLLMSIEDPGYQGELFVESVYAKIKALKKKHPHIKVAVDGGVKMEHLKPLSILGVDRVTVGSAFWKFGDPKTVLAAFRQATL